MSLKKVEKRTEKFIDWLQYLEEKGEVKSNEQLRKILGLKSISTISEIKARRQNIQPDVWTKFKNHFKIVDPDISELDLKKSVVNEDEELLKRSKFYVPYDKDMRIEALNKTIAILQDQVNDLKETVTFLKAQNQELLAALIKK